MIRAYSAGQVTVNNEVIAASVIVMPHQLHRDWGPERFADLTAGHIEALAAIAPEIVLLGTGPRLQFPQPALLTSLMSKGIGVEVMDTSAACRTYNILMSEGRNVAAALIMQ